MKESTVTVETRKYDEIGNLIEIKTIRTVDTDQHPSTGQEENKP